MRSYWHAGRKKLYKMLDHTHSARRAALGRSDRVTGYVTHLGSKRKQSLSEAVMAEIYLIPRTTPQAPCRREETWSQEGPADPRRPPGGSRNGSCPVHIPLHPACHLLVEGRRTQESHVCPLWEVFQVLPAGSGASCCRMASSATHSHENVAKKTGRPARVDSASFTPCIAIHVRTSPHLGRPAKPAAGLAIYQMHP